jgi:hypothetical protein
MGYLLIETISSESVYHHPRAIFSPSIDGGDVILCHTIKPRSVLIETLCVNQVQAYHPLQQGLLPSKSDADIYTYQEKNVVNNIHFQLYALSLCKRQTWALPAQVE